ncbi:MAG: NAD-binding protein [Spirochaetaceae bacterium]|jgi:trk system potassium uptake protein TrkA|nr:NAD-binding protein [Spirochaetaceae bacterium]
MRVIIVGAGHVGTQLARQLTGEKNDVSLIESNEERARHASNRLDCLVIHDEGNKPQVLEEAGIGKADALVCLTNSDEINMIICALAAERYPALLKIALVRNDGCFGEKRIKNTKRLAEPSSASDKSEGNHFLGVDYFIHPNIEASRTALNAIEHNASGEILSFSETDYQLSSIKIAEESPLSGLELQNFRTLMPGDALITLIERDDECLLPSGSTILQTGDRVYMLAREEAMNKLFEMGNKKERAIRKIGIVGGGQLGSLIAAGLLSNPHTEDGIIKSFFSSLPGFIKKSSRKIFIIEQDYGVCKTLSAEFPDAIVLNEDISDENFITEERLNDLDLIVTATGNQELNVITALYLKSRGVKRAIAMVSSDGYAYIARRLGVDIVIPVRSVVVDSLLSRLMGGGVRGIHRLGGGAISIFEIEIGENAPVVETSITKFRISQGALLMLVQRGKTSFLPRGDYIFKVGDKIVILTKKGGKKEIEKYFGVNL